MGIIYLFAFIGSAEKLYNFKRLKMVFRFSLQINIERQYFRDKQKFSKNFVSSKKLITLFVIFNGC